MAFDAFIKFEEPEVKGESTDDKHKDWIEMLSYSWGVSQPQSGSASTAGGASAERADFQDFSFVKALDKASPKLAISCAAGDHFKTVTVELCRAAEPKVKYMEYKFSNCMVTSVRRGGSSQGGETLPLEEVAFNYGKIELTYSQQDRSGGAASGNVAAGWDLQKNKKV